MSALAGTLKIALLFLLAGAAAAADLRVWAGGPAPALVLKDLDGGSRQLSDYRGKVILVNFWATWCGPCRDEMPSIQELKDKLAGKPFVVLAVNLDEPESRIRKFLSQMKLDFTILLDPERKAARAWGARILPASYVIGPDGSVAYSYLGAIDWNAPEVRKAIERLMP